MRLTQIRQPTNVVTSKAKGGRTFIVPTTSTLGDDDDADDDDDGRERERERCRRVMMSQQPGKKEGVHMVQKIGTKKKKRKKKTMRNKQRESGACEEGEAQQNGEKKKRREGRWTTERRWRLCRRRCGLTTRPCGPHRLVLASQPCLCLFIAILCQRY